MLKTLGIIAAGLLLASAGSLAPGEAAAQGKREKVRACGGPAKNYNQCLQVCSCMGGKQCFASCGRKDFSRPGPRGKAGKGAMSRRR